MIRPVYMPPQHASGGRSDTPEESGRPCLFYGGGIDQLMQPRHERVQ